MRLTAQFQIRVRDAIRAEPIHGNTIRRIDGLGNHYIALKSASVDENLYTKIFTASIDDISHSFYYKIDKIPIPSE